MAGLRAGSGRAWLLLLIGSTGMGCEHDPQPTEAPGVALDALVSISPEAMPFGRIVDIELGDDGLLYVLDAQSRSVRVFDQDGLEIAQFGERGRGPGEFERPARLVWRPNGELWVLDPGNARLSSFDTTGRLLTTHPFPDTGIFFPLAVGFDSPDTLRWVGLSSPDLSNMSAAWAETVLEEGAWRPEDTQELPFVQWPELFRLESEGMVAVLPVPFSGEPQFELDDAGHFWYATTASPAVHRWSPSTGLESRIEVDVRPSPVTPADVAEALAAPDLEELRSYGEEAVNRFSDMIPQTRPPISGFFFGERGQVWIVQGSEQGEGTRAHEVVIVDSMGARVGAARLELTVVPRPRVRGGVLATVTRDELGVESVRLYRVAG